ncbi:MAG TPA: anthranilate synthase component I [Pyrinomonadaceae bacterium]|nr:anthranilate synthase component I [Pyrinomonadaceae bacterium]
MAKLQPENFSDFHRQCTEGNVVPVIRTLAADLITPFGAYLRLAQTSENAFLLESVEGGERLARYSFLGSEPEMIARGTGDKTILERNGSTETLQTRLPDFLREYFRTKKLASNAECPPFSGGAVGFFGFNAVRWFEPALAKNNFSDDSDIAAFMFFRTVVAFDHARQQISVISLVFTDEVGKEGGRLNDLYDNAVAETERIARNLEQNPILIESLPPEENSGYVSNWKPEEFEEGVRRIKEYILSGDCYQAVLSQRFSKKTTASPESIYRALRRLNPSPYLFLLRMGEKSIIGASPEMLIKCRGKQVEYRPIAGTRPRGASEKDDDRLAEEMRADEKEVAEHMMLVDLGRNDLGRVAKYGSVSIEKLMTIEKYSHVQHLVSSLSAELRPDVDRFDALAACFPAGTVTGAPKVRAMQIIEELEPDERGVYSGAVGYIDYAGNLDTCIAIRTLWLENGVANVQAGAGIVADSVPAREYEETVNKAQAVLRAIEMAETDS